MDIEILSGARFLNAVTPTKKIYEGKAKIVFATDDPNLVVQHFKNDATAFDGKKKGQIEGKGVINTRISAALFKMLGKNGIKNHFKKLLSDNEMLTTRVDIVLVEVVVRNIAAGSLSKRIGYPEGTVLSKPIVEFYYKNDDLGDPLISEDHIFELKLVSPEQLKEIKKEALKINDLLLPFFNSAGLDLVDFKLEFGLDSEGNMLLADEISPDTCRLWDKETKEKMDKDRFRRDLGNVEQAYQEVLKRVEASIQF
jgi:phosphoribosylaminoimidazole-succinocarboxamide synthase